MFKICGSTEDEISSEFGAFQLAQDFEVIDLQPSVSPNADDVCLDGSLEGTSFLNDLISDESLYTRYLNGAISFDDLIREIHVNDNQTEAISQSDSSSDSSNVNDPSYSPPKRRSKRQKSSKEVNKSVKRDQTVTKKTRRSRKARLPIELAQYLGEAERHLNNDEFEEAERICREIIESAPKASQPYIVLAEINYRRGNNEKTKELLLEAVQRNPNDINTWLTLVDLAEERDDLPLAIYSSRQALKTDKHDSSIRQRLINYYQKAGRSRDALQLRLSALSINPELNGEAQFKIARQLADDFFKLMDPNGSIRAYESAFDKYPDHGTDNDRNTALSMMIELKHYSQALMFFVNYCGVKIYCQSGDQLIANQITSNMELPNVFDKCVVPKRLIPELYFKLFLVLVHLDVGKSIFTQVKLCFERKNTSEYSHWILDIIKAYREKNLFNEVVTLVLTLKKMDVSPKLIPAWIILAESYLEIGKTNEAIDSYRYIIGTLDPRNTEARLKLGNLFRRLGKHQDALEILNPVNLVRPTSSSKRQLSDKPKTSSYKSRNKQPTKKSTPSETSDLKSDPNVSMYDSDIEGADEDIDLSWIASPDNPVPQDLTAYRLAYERCRMLDQPETENLFLKETWSFLFTAVIRICGFPLTKLALVLNSEQHHNSLINQLASVTPNITDTIPTNTKNDNCELSGSAVWALFLRLIDVLLSRVPKSMPQLERAAAWGSLLPHVHRNGTRRLTLSHLLISTSLIMRHGLPAYSQLRNLQKQWGDKNQYWNVLNLAITLSRDFQHCRVLNRSISREGFTLALGTMVSSDTLVRGLYRFAVARLIKMRETYPDDALLSLLLAVAFLSMSTQRSTGSQHLAVLQAIGFLGEYKRLRGPCQEVYYNIARACHQLLLTHVALKYYEKVLNTQPVGDTDEQRSYTNLQKEAAFNMSLIYRTSGNLAMARHLIQTYIVI